MATMTLTVHNSVLEQAERVAEEQHVTRDAVLNDWLEDRALGAQRVRKYDQLMDRLKHVNSSGPYTRDEMNDR